MAAVTRVGFAPLKFVPRRVLAGLRVVAWRERVSGVQRVIDASGGSLEVNGLANGPFESVHERLEFNRAAAKCQPFVARVAIGGP